ncbi:MAG: hypothetical protein ACRC4S_07595 [Cetobacterium sp.]
MNKIREVLCNYWEPELVMDFYEDLEDSVLSYKIDCLEFFIDEMLTENPQITELEIMNHARNMDAYVSSEEFLIDFFKCTKTPEGDSIARRLENDEKEVERLVHELIMLKKIRVKEKPNEFIVWYI